MLINYFPFDSVGVRDGTSPRMNRIEIATNEKRKGEKKENKKLKRKTSVQLEDGVWCAVTL